MMRDPFRPAALCKPGRPAVDDIARRLVSRIALGMLLLFVSWASAGDNAAEAVRQLLVAQFDKPGARLMVEPVAVSGDAAVAGWLQGDRGGRALLARTNGAWHIVLCAGDALKSARFMQEAGVTARDAEAIARALAVAEEKLTPTQRARLASFDGVVRMNAGSQHSHGQKP